jgi:hypothetical protein
VVDEVVDVPSVVVVEVPSVVVVVSAAVPSSSAPKSWNIATDSATRRRPIIRPVSSGEPGG